MKDTRHAVQSEQKKNVVDSPYRTRISLLTGQFHIIKRNFLRLQLKYDRI